MGVLSFPVVLGLLMVSAAASILVLWLMGLIEQRRQSAQDNANHPARTNSFLFCDHTLTDHDVTDLAAHLPNLEDLKNWSELRDWLGGQFGELPLSLQSLNEDTEHHYENQVPGAQSELTLTRSGQFTRVTLHDPLVPSPAAWFATDEIARSMDEAQDVLDHAPFPIWKTNAAGRLIWKNAPCAMIERALDVLPTQKGKASARFSVPRADGEQPNWYEVTSHDIGKSSTLHFATEIDQVIQAESAQRDFVQTLTKTFASLTTGLAVFDKNRQLALFNPALVDLTGLAVTFLSARPDVIRFFDELRERQVLPEPKNYASLRTQIRDVIAKANEGRYLEIWNLPGGVTYRVTGRPHPDGAVAILFEDISAEILKTQQFRTQIDLGQSVIDGLDHAIVVIAPNDLIMLCNTAATDLIKIDPGNSFVDMSVGTLISACRDQFHSDALWAIFEANLRDGTIPHSTGLDRHVNSRAGHQFQYRIKTLPGGMRMLSFTKVKTHAQAPALTMAE